MNERFESINDKMKKLDAFTKNANKGELYEIARNIDKMRNILTDLDRDIKELESEAQNESLDNNTVRKIENARKDYDLKRKKVNEIDQQYTKKSNIDKLKQGELTGVQKQHATRDYIVDIHKETDIQGDIVKDIHRDIRDANGNLQEIGAEVENQGQTIVRIKEGVDVATGSVQKADKGINEMNRRNWCMKFLMHLVIVLLTIGNLTCGGILIYQSALKKNNNTI